MATFPGGIFAPSTKVDGVDYYLAAHMNDVQNEIIALETFALDKILGLNLLYSTLSHDIWPQGVTFTGILDDVYAGLWNSLHSGVTPTITGVAGGGSDSLARYLKFANGGTVYGGIVQFLSNADTIPLRGQPVSISADLWGTNITTLRMAVIVWTGTADALTSDVVSAWGAGNPTLAANWAYIGTPADLTITTTRARFTVPNLTVPANAVNLGFFIWLPNTEASGDFFNVARTKLEEGTTATDFTARPFAAEKILTEQFLEKSYNLALAIGTGNEMDTNENTGLGGACTVGDLALAMRRFAVEKVKTPVITVYDTAGTAGKVSLRQQNGAITANITPTVDLLSTRAFRCYAAATLTTQRGILFHWLADARL